MKHRYIQLNFLKEENPKDFFAWCLDNKLYKKDEFESNFKSRMKEIYIGNKEYNGISATIAYEEEVPIGICLLEQKIDENGKIPITRGGLLHLDNRERKNPWEKRFDLQFIYAGFISFYVKPENRNQGVAKKLLAKMEELQYKRIKEELPEDIKGNINQHYLVITARELAIKVVENSNLFLNTPKEQNSKQYNNSISRYSYEIVFNEKKLVTIGEYSEKKLVKKRKNKILN